MTKMTDADLRELLVRRRDASVKHLDDNRNSDRIEAMRFYRGDNMAIYGNSGDGLSTVVSKDMFEAVESMLPGLVKPFVAGDEVVRFEPTGPEDEEGAKQATEYINYVFSNHNNAFRVVYDFLKDGLIYRLGVAKVVYETIVDKNLQTYSGLDQIALDAIEAEPDYEIVGDIMQTPDGLFEVRVSQKTEMGKYRVIIIAPDRFLFEERLASLDEARFLGHRETKPIGDFVAMGLDKEKLFTLRTDAPSQDEDDRFEYEGPREDSGDDDEDLARLVTVDECYIRCDYEGSGALGWRKVFIGSDGKEILLNEEADDHPYEAWTPIPIPHKLVGMSVFDLVKDIQMQGTALIREAMNALYLANRPQREVVEGQVNIEDLLNPTVGGVVRVKTAGMVREIASGGANVMQQSLGMIEHLATIREQRTGSTRYNQGMDSNSLNKTATGISIIQNASQQRAELVARVFAEAFKGVFQKLLGLVSRHQDKAETIRLRGEWVEMDPTDWKTNYDTTATVGLGTGNKEQMVAHITQLLGIMAQTAQAQDGLNGPLCTWDNVYEAQKSLIEAMGFKGTEKYLTEPPKKDEQGQQEGPQTPDPQQMAQQAQEQQMQAQQAADAAKLAADTDKAVKVATINAKSALDVARLNAEKEMLIAGVDDKIGILNAFAESLEGPDTDQGGEEPLEMPQEAPPEEMQEPMEPDMHPDDAAALVMQAMTEGGQDEAPPEQFDTGMMP